MDGASDDSMKITLAVYCKPSEYGEGKIESHREYEIVHDIENGLIQALDADGQDFQSLFGEHRPEGGKKLHCR